MKDKLDDEIKFGLRIRDSKPSDTVSRGQSDPMDVDAVNSLSSGKGKGSSSPRDGCFKRGSVHSQRDCNARKGNGKQLSGKGKQSKSWSKSGPSLSGKGKSEENKGKSKGTKSANRGAKGSHKGKTSKIGLSGLENSKSETSSELGNRDMYVPLILPGTMVGIVTNGTMAGVTMNGMMIGVLLDGMRVGIKLVTILKTHFHLEVLILVP